MIQRLREAGLQMSAQESQGPVSDKLDGKTIVISGNFSISREDMKQLIASHGGKNSGSVSGKTAFLLAGDKPGPEKIKKAEALGVKIVSEDEFWEIIGRPEPVQPLEGEQLSLF